MTEIAAAAGVSRRTLFRWFPSKAALVWGGTLEADERFEAGWEAASDAGTGHRNMFARVRAAYAASLAPLGETIDITRLRLRLIDENPAVYAWGHELRGSMSTRLAAHFAEELRLDPDSLRVTSLVAAISGASYSALAWWAKSDDPRPPVAVLDEALEALAGLFEGEALEL
jgi:AcrR family transcriptional regulator